MYYIDDNNWKFSIRKSIGISGDSFVRFGTLVGSVRSRVSANGAFLRANRFPITTHSADIELKGLSTARFEILSEMWAGGRAESRANVPNLALQRT